MVAELKPQMTDAEIELYSRHLVGCRNLVEFGCGGSTRLAVEHGISSIDSIESDPQWVRDLTGHPFLRPAIADKRLRLHHVDIGPVRAWGSPANRAHATKWRDYYGWIWNRLSEKPDVVLVDGRWRVSCTIRAIVEAPDATIVIHDFWERPHYHVVLGFLEHLATADTMGVFKPRKDIDWQALCRVADQYGTDHR